MVNEENVQKIISEMRRAGERLDDSSVSRFLTDSYSGRAVETYPVKDVAEAVRRYRDGELRG